MMPVNRDASGRRYVEAEVEVPGTPEEVWAAIATGPGISSWFVPSKVEEREGGAITASYGPGMDSLSTITAWDPPHRFTADSRDDMGPDDPTIATEWTVETRAGGTCVVRVVHSWFTSKDDWDEQYEGTVYGWLSFFKILRAYLDHFSGQPCAPFQLMAMAPEPKDEAWQALVGPLGVANATVGGHVFTAPEAPPASGTAEWVGPAEWPELLVRLDEPAPGLAHFVPYPMGGQVCLMMRFFLYGDHASPAAAQAEPVWQTWLAERFPLADEESGAA
jgi:uncharacterized protein YndB with AHSA1/START domain